MAQMALAVPESDAAGAYHYFSAQGCVLVDGDRRLVFVGGTLVSSYDIGDKATRNAVLLKLSEDPKVHLGKLVDAFELSREQLRNLQKKYAAGGLPGVMVIKQGGRAQVVTPSLRRKLYELFDAGASINHAHAKIKGCISRTMVALALGARARSQHSYCRRNGRRRCRSCRSAAPARSFTRLCV